MPTLEINGRQVEVDDSFLSMSPEQQEATVDDIALSLSRESEGGARVDPGHGNVPEFVPPGVEGYNPDTGKVEAQDPGALGTAIMAGAEGVPLIGGMLDKGVHALAAGAGSLASGQPYAQVYREMGAIRDKGREEHPIARIAGNVAGGIATLGPLAGTRAGGYALGIRGPNLATRTLAAGGSSASLAVADTLARGGSMEDAGRSALIGGGIGMALPGIGNMLSQRGSAAAVRAAPSIEDLGTAGREAFKTAHAAGVGLKPQAFDRSLWSLSAKLKSFGFDPDLQKGTATVLNRLSQTRGKPLDLQELHNLRKLAGHAARGQEASDREAARLVIETIDDLVDDAANFTLGRGNALGAPGAATASPATGLNALKDGIKTWHTMRKAETVQELFRRAEITAGSNKGPAYAKALRQEFKSLAKRKNGLRGFTPAEKRIIEQVAKGADSRQLTAAFGRLLRSLPAIGAAGFGGGGPLGIAGMAAAGHGIEQAALRSGARTGINAAERAAAFVRSGGTTGGRNYAPNVATPLERSLRPAPLLTHDRRPG